MKKTVVLLILYVAVCLTGCKNYGEKRIVTLLMADSEKVAVYYYDFSAEKPAYLKEEKQNTGLENTLVQLLSEYDYDLKLCKYVIVSEDIIKDSAEELYFALTDTRFAPDIVILQGDTDADMEQFEKLNKANYPVYNYSFDANMMYGVIETAYSSEKNIIAAGRLYKTLNTQQSFVFDVLADTINNGTYIFEYNKDSYSAQLDGISVFFTERNNILNLNITAVLESYKGMQSGEESRRSFIGILEADIKQNAETLVTDTILAENLNLLWYKKISSFEGIDINVNII